MKRTVALGPVLMAVLLFAVGRAQAFGSDPASYLFVASRLQPEITIIDIATDAVVRRIALPGIPSQMIALDRGRRLAVGDVAARQVRVLDVISLRIERSVDVKGQKHA